MIKTMIVLAALAIAPQAMAANGDASGLAAPQAIGGKAPRGVPGALIDKKKDEAMPAAFSTEKAADKGRFIFTGDERKKP